MVRKCISPGGIVRLSLCQEKGAVTTHGGVHCFSLLTSPLWVTHSFFPFFLPDELRGGRTETGLVLKYLLHTGFPGGRNASVPQVLIIITDGRSQGQVAPPAKQLQERGVTVFAVGVRFPR